ncbi:YndJ family transporter [Alkalicoccus urumqiensis]|uniref:YndJ-like protein n=1 Tax=Alkalicoccus urumqiensis TaxID=1548213 RepID=A0A2P6MI82_ALKUR|nr:YndJ family transporter [Alkalicoccus urumqiensis]PRO65992.1 hypothetical protein C6I21_06730 [Alkalicoccus urumqiensis]
MKLKVNILTGAAIGIIWLLLVDVTIVEIALALSFLILIPLLIHIAVPKRATVTAEHWLFWLSDHSVAAALFALAAVTLDNYWISVLCAAVWLVYTGLIAMMGAVRIWNRRIYPAEEMIIDIGLLFTAVGGMWLLLSEAGIHRLLPYSEITIQLTAVHYHYSAVVVTILTGAFGRFLFAQTGKTGPLYRFLAIGTAVGSPLIALGVVQGPPLEVVYVTIYSTILLWMSVWWFILLPRMPLRARWFIGTASVTLFISIGVTMLYAIGMVTETQFVTLDMMFYWHGAVNSLGFSLFGVVGWYLLGSQPKRTRN